MAWVPALPAGSYLLLTLTGAAPLSAPAFSLVFPFLKMVLTEMSHHSEEEEERMAQILQILTVHAQLRASPSTPPGRVDEVGKEALLSPWFKGDEGGRACGHFLSHEQFWWGNGGCMFIPTAASHSVVGFSRQKRVRLLLSRDYRLWLSCHPIAYQST